MDKTIKKYVIRPSQDGYAVNEIIMGEYTPKEGEFIAQVTESEDGYNNQDYTIEFACEDEFICFNEWLFPHTIHLTTHYKGSYESTHMELKCISPDGLKVDISFNEKEHMYYNPLIYLFSKMWITSCATASELDILKPNRCSSNAQPSDENIAHIARSIAYLKKLTNSYKENENVNVHIRWALKKEYEYRLKILLELAGKS